MFNLLCRIRTHLTVTVQGAYCEEFLSKCSEMGVAAQNVKRMDGYTVCFSCEPGQETALKSIAAQTQTEILSLRVCGAARAGKAAKRHTIGLSILSMLMAVLILSRAYIWEIEVSGNQKIPTGEVLAVLRECGVREGTFWPSLQSDDIRNRAMERLPEAAWLTVNISGSHANVILRERVDMPQMVSDSEKTDIVSRCAGYVMKVSALEGKAMVKPGELVSPGQILISGTLDSVPGIQRTVHALGDVYAQVYTEKTGVSPDYTLRKVYTGEKHSRLAIIIGKYRINFYINSSISGQDCDKIRKEYILGVKDLFLLPVRIQRETEYVYTLNRQEKDETALLGEMRSFLVSGLEDAQNVKSVFTHENGAMTVCVRAREEISIGKTVPIEPKRMTEEGNSQ